MYQEDIIIINIYAPKSKVPKYMRQNGVKLKGERNNNSNYGLQ